VVTFSRFLSTGSLSHVDGFNNNADVVRWYKYGIDTANRVDEDTMQTRVQLMETVKTELISF
jgi:hypothetical protein